MDGLWNLKGWQWLFLLEGLPSVVLGVVTWFYLNDTPDQATWLDDDEKQALKTMIAREQELAIAHAATPRSTLREVLTPAVLLYTLAYFCLTNTLSAINIWTPQNPAKLQHRQQQYRDWPAGGDPAVLHHPRDDLVEPPLRQAERAKKAHHPAVSVCSGGMDAGLGDRSQPDPAAWHHHGLNRIVHRHGDILDHAGIRLLACNPARWRWR